MTTSTLTPRHIASRTAVAILGGYAFTWGVIALGIALLYTAGMEFHDAEHLSYIIGFLVFLTAFLVAFATQRLGKMALILVGGGAAMSAVAWWLQSLIIATGV
ncbi:iron uptake protein [Telluria beijingensis]|uniref:iron uptake protein n=1 Tax=Telluria beijingensis TaxID=3068633 RepID=UPI00279575DA|nr:iron uptake protein [Massilia sp. REN29]